MKFKYLIILVATMTLGVLYGVSLVSHPPQVSLSSLSNYDGQQVIIQGIVTDYRTTTFGSQLITLRDCINGTGSTVVYVDGVVSVEFGDRIQAIGKVQRYKDQWEVMVSNPQVVTLMEKWSNQAFPLWQLARQPDRYCDTNINVTGIITQKQSSSFVLADTTETYFLDVSCDQSSLFSFSNGDAVAVAGRFIYEPRILRFILKLSEQNHRIIKRGG
jgi:hypothetical protein